MRPRRKRGDSCLAGRASCPSYLCAVQGVAAIETSGWLPRPPATYPPIHLPAGQRARFIDAAKGPPQEAPLPVPPYSCCTAPRRADQLALPHQPTYYTSNATRVTEQGMPLSLLLRPSARPFPSPFPHYAPLSAPTALPSTTPGGVWSAFLRAARPFVAVGRSQESCPHGLRLLLIKRRSVVKSISGWP